MNPAAPTLIETDIRTPERLARAMREHRRSRGITQAETARLAGVSPQWLSEFETGRVAGGTERVMRVMGVLGLSLALQQRPRTIADRVLEAASQTP